MAQVLAEIRKGNGIVGLEHNRRAEGQGSLGPPVEGPERVAQIDVGGRESRSKPDGRAASRFGIGMAPLIVRQQAETVPGLRETRIESQGRT